MCVCVYKLNIFVPCYLFSWLNSIPIVAETRETHSDLWLIESCSTALSVMMSESNTSMLVFLFSFLFFFFMYDQLELNMSMVDNITI